MDEERRHRIAVYLERLEMYDHFYTERGMRSMPCIYCKKPSTGWDHVPALVTFEYLTENGIDLHMNPYKVRSCQKCNDTLQDQPLTTVVRRKEYLLNRYTEIVADLQDRIEGIKKNEWNG